MEQQNLIKLSKKDLLKMIQNDLTVDVILKEKTEAKRQSVLKYFQSDKGKENTRKYYKKDQDRINKAVTKLLNDEFVLNEVLQTLVQQNKITIL